MIEEAILEKEEEFKNLHYRMYENEYPKEDDLVYAKVVEIKDNMAYVSLYEYDNILGMIYSSEVTVAKCKNINRFTSIGKDEVLIVLNVDKKKGHIDLSKKRVNPDETQEYKKKFRKSKAIENIVKVLSVHTKKSMAYLYKNIIWPLYKKYEHAYDAFQLFLNGDKTIFDDFIFSDNIKNELFQIIKSRLNLQPVKITSLFELTCSSFEGIDAIKTALLNGEKKGSESVPIKFRYIGSPLYECSVSTTNKNEAIKVMNIALKEVKKSIEAKGGNFNLREEPKEIGEKEKSIKEQLEEISNKCDEEEEDEETNYEE